MTDPPLILKRLAFVETCIADLRREARSELVRTDLKERRFAEHTLQVGIQALQDAAAHIAAAERLGEPRTNAGLFDLLAAGGWLDAGDAALGKAMVGFRNVLVHGYAAVDLAVLEDVLENHLDDLERIAGQLRDGVERTRT